jgi:hypothetical protein
MTPAGPGRISFRSVKTEIGIFVAKREDVQRKIILDRHVLLAKDLTAFS